MDCRVELGHAADELCGYSAVGFVSQQAEQRVKDLALVLWCGSELKDNAHQLSPCHGVAR